MVDSEEATAIVDLEQLDLPERRHLRIGSIGMPAQFSTVIEPVIVTEEVLFQLLLGYSLQSSYLQQLS